MITLLSSVCHTRRFDATNPIGRYTVHNTNTQSGDQRNPDPPPQYICPSAPVIFQPPPDHHGSSVDRCSPFFSAEGLDFLSHLTLSEMGKVSVFDIMSIASLARDGPIRTIHNCSYQEKFAFDSRFCRVFVAPVPFSRLLFSMMTIQRQSRFMPLRFTLITMFTTRNDSIPLSR